MFEQTQFDLLRTWVVAATELPDVILSHPSAPRPQSDYAALTLLRSDPIGRPAELIFEDNPAYTGPTDLANAPMWEFLNQEYEFGWQIDIYATDPVNVANRLRPWFHSATGRELLGELNPFHMSGVRRVPELVNQNWQDRATLDLRVRAYVCTGTADYATTQVLLGRVPVDIAEVVDFTINTGGADRTEQATKP